ncbi:hypothetical protein NG798_09370 [Ancylothrix sp. C2]|uniref:hypothetical protein n=1 Tax=Ancylothrix sp. D3o TaxID=2953691 RepID=UPI0021BA3D4C|nr:hypothetical protein [Ancylothrix sp. D3o]MCT7949995.1 hypothetical protein [Ancylothrix sp. D3o]
MEDFTTLIIPEINGDNWHNFNKIVTSGLTLAAMLENPLNNQSVDDCMDALSDAGFDPRVYLTEAYDLALGFLSHS